MGIFVPRHRATHRRFTYEPRFYNPKKDEDIRRRMRIQSKSRSHRRKSTSLVYLFALLIGALYLMFSLG